MTERVTNKRSTQSNDGAFEDPRGEFPTPTYWNSSSINYAATGQKTNSLWVGGGSEGTSVEEGETTPSKYYHNSVTETRSGHVVEMDDTPGNERILIMHKELGGIEVKPDGSVTISTPQNRVDVVGGSQTVIVEGDAQLVYKGNLSLKVTGDLNIDCMNFNVNAKGNKTENISGSHRRNINGNVGDVVRGSSSSIVSKQVTNTYLGGFSNNVKGTYSNNVDGTAGFYSSGNTFITSQGIFNAASDKTVMSANDMTIQGGTGIIGGTAVDFVGNGAIFDQGVQAPTFHGDLTGRADEAIKADTANYGPSTGTPAGWSNTNTAVPANISDVNAANYAVPTSSSISNYLSKAAGGIRKVKIDIGNYLSKFLDRTETYGGVSSVPVTTAVSRSRMRDPANRNNTAFMGAALAEGAVCANYTKPAPEGIGRVVAKSSSSNTNGNPINPANAYVPKDAPVRLIPEFRYNPIFNTPITTETKLAEGITIAKFLGTDDPTNLDFIRDQTKRTEIAKYYYLHAQIMKTVQENKDDFKDVRLVVSEGLYRPGPTENITPGSINDLKLQGRAVVYNLIGADGKTAYTKLFDLAVAWKDTIYYDKLILDYDTIDCSGEMAARIIVTLPEVDENWEAVYTKQIETRFNNNLLSIGEFTECLPFATNQQTTTNPDNVELSSGGEYGVNLTSGMGAQITRTASVHPEVRSSAVRTLQSLLDNQYTLMQQYYGGALYINDALPLTSTRRTPPSAGGGSQHWYGKALDINTANMSNADRIKLVQAAARAGFKGFGFGRTILHIDIGPKRYWDYDQGSFAGKPTSYWFTWVDTNVRG